MDEVDAFAVGQTVFTGSGAGIVLGYKTEDQGNGTTKRLAIVGRFAGSEEVDANDLAASPSRESDAGIEAGAVPAEPTVDTGAGPGAATVDVGGTVAETDPPTSTQQTVETDAERERRQDAELADLRARHAAENTGR